MCVVKPGSTMKYGVEYATKDEMSQFWVKFPNDEKLCVSTVYRVGTLGFDNFREIKKHFEILAKKQKLNKHILVGDFNFSEVAWPEGSTSCELHRSFLEFFQGIWDMSK